MGRHSQWVCSGLVCLSSPDIWVTKLRGTCPSPQPGDEAPAQDGLGLSRPGASLPIFSPATEGRKERCWAGVVGGGWSVWGWAEGGTPRIKMSTEILGQRRGHKIPSCLSPHLHPQWLQLSNPRAMVRCRAEGEQERMRVLGRE